VQHELVVSFLLDSTYSNLFSAGARLRETLIVSWSKQAIELLVLMQSFDQFTIDAREINIFLGLLCEPELIYKICHGRPSPLTNSHFGNSQVVY